MNIYHSRLLTGILVILMGWLFGCSSHPLPATSQHQVRLARAWRPQFWQTIGALNRQGPLTVGLWESQRFKRQGLNVSPWVSPVIVDALRLTKHRGLQGNVILKDQEVTLDGLQETLRLDFNVLTERQLQHFPPSLDMIIPRSALADLLDLADRELKVHSSGFISNSQPQGLVTSLEQSGNEYDINLAHLTRFERWSPAKSYDNLIIGGRVDHKGKILIKWRRPRVKLPKDLWLLVNIAPRWSAPQALGLWIIPESKSVQFVAPSVISSLTLSTESEMQSSVIKGERRCTYTTPCPVTLIDVVRRCATCHHDICTYTPQLKSSGETK